MQALVHVSYINKYNLPNWNCLERTLNTYYSIDQLFWYTGPPELSPNTPWLNTVPVIEGNTAELRCDVTGSPPPSITWFAMEDGKIRCIYCFTCSIACADPEIFFWGGGGGWVIWACQGCLRDIFWGLFYDGNSKKFEFCRGWGLIPMTPPSRSAHAQWY